MADQNESERSAVAGWTGPTYTVDDDGKISGYEITREPNNWGRWGDLDERGTANFITAEAVVAAASLVKTGEIISCAIPLDRTGPVHPARPGIVHTFSLTGADFLAASDMSKLNPGMQAADDFIFMPLQGSTQWDGLAHIGWDDTLYNGF